MTRREVIFEFEDKLNGLEKWAAHQGHADLQSERAIATKTGIKRGTLVSGRRDRKLTRNHQIALANAFGFSVDWPEWRDVDGDLVGYRRDTANAFIKKFKQQAAQPRRLTVTADQTGNHLDRRFADFSFGLAHNRSISDDNVAIPLSISLSFDQRGKLIKDEEGQKFHNVGLKQVDLEIFYSNKKARVESFEITANGEDDANFGGFVKGLGPWWLIRPINHDERSIGGRIVANGKKDCLCHGFLAGDQLRVKMTARVNGCFVTLNDHELEGASLERLAVYEQLVKLAALNGTEVILGEQTLTVVVAT